MAQHKMQGEFVDDGFGFPVVLRNVPMVKVRGTWTPNIDYNALAKDVALKLAHKKSKLTGHEIRFIRQFFNMTLESFGKRFDVSHPAVMKWERAADGSPNLKWPLEKDIRMFILEQLNAPAKAFKQLYHQLRSRPRAGSKATPMQMDLKQAA